MLAAGRNRIGLTPHQINQCQIAWADLCNNDPVLDISRAGAHLSRTEFSEDESKVYLGADAYPGMGVDPNSRMSMLACLAHELAHAERFARGYCRSTELPDVLVDEAEASLWACFVSILSPKDREDLVEDARDRLNDWLRIRRERKEL